MTVDVRIARTTSDDRARLDALLQLYVYDFSEMLPLDVDESGRFAFPPVEADHAFLFRVDDKLAGFALVQERSRLTGAPVRDMAEFFVMRRYRRRGVGEIAARWLFDALPGPWEVRQKAENVAAIAFWRRVIGAYTHGRFEETTMDDERWRGPVQRFGRIE